MGFNRLPSCLPSFFCISEWRTSRKEIIEAARRKAKGLDADLDRGECLGRVCHEIDTTRYADPLINSVLERSSPDQPVRDSTRIRYPGLRSKMGARRSSSDRLDPAFRTAFRRKGRTPARAHPHEDWSRWVPRPSTQATWTLDFRVGKAVVLGSTQAAGKKLGRTAHWQVVTSGGFLRGTMGGECLGRVGNLSIAVEDGMRLRNPRGGLQSRGSMVDLTVLGPVHQKSHATFRAEAKPALSRLL